LMVATGLKAPFGASRRTTVHFAGGVAGGVQLRLMLWPPSLGVSVAVSGKADADPGPATATTSAAVAAARTRTKRMAELRRELLVRAGRENEGRDDKKSRAGEASGVVRFRPTS
jgi:hypothetical protein